MKPLIEITASQGVAAALCAIGHEHLAKEYEAAVVFCTEALPPADSYMQRPEAVRDKLKSCSAIIRFAQQLCDEQKNRMI